MSSFQPLRGFRDLFPQDKASQTFVFETLRNVAKLFGYEEYDGPVVEPLDLYTGKTSKDLLERQTFQVRGKEKDENWILRPEMTPTLARMIANKAGELTFPLRLFNLGLRYRYEAPQKGRLREFYQADFDILGSADVLADAEIIVTAVSILIALGFSKDDFEVQVNSRSFMQRKLADLGVDKNKIQETLIEIDKMDKKEGDIENEVIEFVRSKINPTDDSYFKALFSTLSTYGLEKLCTINLSVVRGLDYYTGLVFEIKKKGEQGRTTLIGGGRYDNLIADFNPNARISGVGFALSDVVLLEFLKDKNLLPEQKTKSTKVLVTVFSEETVGSSIEAVSLLRGENIAAELYPSTGKKLDKQLKYADRSNIPYVLIIGPEEMKKNTYKLKNLQTQEQKEVSRKQLLKEIV